MFRKVKYSKIISEEKGFGLVAAMFAVVILALFGVLAARYISTTAVTSAEDFLWSQTLYSAESNAHLRILFRDNGGNFGGIPPNPVIQNVTSNITENWNGIGNPSTLNIQGTIPGMNISRTMEIKFIL